MHANSASSIAPQSQEKKQSPVTKQEAKFLNAIKVATDNKIEQHIQLVRKNKRSLNTTCKLKDFVSMYSLLYAQTKSIPPPFSISHQNFTTIYVQTRITVVKVHIDDAKLNIETDQILKKKRSVVSAIAIPDAAPAVSKKKSPIPSAAPAAAPLPRLTRN